MDLKLGDPLSFSQGPFSSNCIRGCMPCVRGVQKRSFWQEPPVAREFGCLPKFKSRNRINDIDVLGTMVMMFWLPRLQAFSYHGYKLSVTMVTLFRLPCSQYFSYHGDDVSATMVSVFWLPWLQCFGYHGYSVSVTMFMMFRLPRLRCVSDVLLPMSLFGEKQKTQCSYGFVLFVFKCLAIVVQKYNLVWESVVV